MDLIGTTIGNYRIDRLLGEGSMGAVYQAYDLFQQSDVAIKLISPDFTRQLNFREHFSQEVRAASEMDHPGIVKVFDFGQHKDQLYIVMEYIPGINLRQLLDESIRERKLFPLSEAILLLQQLCQTLEFCHQNGVLHRDINPTNLMLKPEPTKGLLFRVILTDLGLARLAEEQGISQEGTSPVTLAYMSPEQVLGKDTDARSSVYSLGVLLYEVVVGILPLPIKTAADALLYHTKELPPAPRFIRPDLPEPLEQVILKALEKDPGRRYPSADELGTALAGVIIDSTEIVDQVAEQDIGLVTRYSESLIVPVDIESTSLMRADDLGKTQLQQSLLPGPAEITPKVQISIQVLSKGRKPQMFTLSADTITIGRDKDNQIVLGDPEVSRRHVQITCDGPNYYVTDLKSRNGTYLENIRLQADTPKIWKYDQELRIGSNSLRRISQTHPGTVIHDVGAGLVNISLMPQQLAVEPGGSVTASLSLLNQSPNVDHFSLSLIGIPNSWIGSLPTQVKLVPGEQKETSFSLHVPLSSQSRAGRHQITLRATSRHDPSQFVEVKLTLTVAAYSQFGAELQPQRLPARQIGQLTISNQGNIQESFTIQFADPAGELTFEPPQIQVRVPPGRAVTAQYRGNVKPSLPSYIGGEKLHPFSAQVILPNRETQTLHGDMISRGLIPIWVLTMVMLLCLLFTGSAAALWYYYRPTPTPTLAPIALDTAITSKLLNGNNVTFSFEAKDSDTAGTSFECQLDNDSFTACTSPVNYNSLTDGPHTFMVRAKDAEGNIDQSPDSFSWTITITALDTTISSTPSNLSGSGSAMFAFSGTDSGVAVATFECQLDNGGFTACTNPISYSSLADGSHNFQVRAKDAEGNIDQFPASFTWTIDTTPPDTKITSQPSNPSNTNSAEFGFNRNDSGTDGVTFECQLDNRGFTACVSPTSYSNLANGPHTFEVRAKDAAGNIDQSPGNFNWIINATSPETTITNKASIPSNSSTVNFNFSGTDDVTPPSSLTFECKLDSGNFEACTSPKTYNGLADSSHIFQVRAKDAAGNIDQSPDIFNWTIDSTPPVVKTISLPATTPPPDAPSVIYIVTLSESVTGVDLTDFELIESPKETIDAEVSNVAGSGTTYFVTVNINSGIGTIKLQLKDNDSIVDAANNKLGGEGLNNGNFTSNEHTINRPSVPYPNP